MFNVVDPETGWKADLIIRNHRPFSEAEFSRGEATDVVGVRLAIASIEDVILSKLESRGSALPGGSSMTSARCSVVGDGVDRTYLERWVAALGVRAGWKAAQE